MDRNAHIALNAAAPQAGENRFSLNMEIPLGDGGGDAGTVPEWIELIPPGREVKGRDGRDFVNDRPEGIVAAFADFHPIPIGWGHRIELAPPEDAPPAAAWVEEIEAREGGAIFGRVAWNHGGRYSVASRELRFISPTFLYEKESRRILQLLAVGLTNRPNLRLPALNNAQNPTGESEMDKKILAALGLPEDATEDQALNAVTKLKAETALNQAKAAEAGTPSLDKFVPRADFDQALAKATNAENALAERDTAELKTAGETAVNAAVEAGKIAPAGKEFYLATCASKEGLAEFQKFVKSAPRVIAGDTGLDGKDPSGQRQALNSAELEVCRHMGLNPAEFQKARGDTPPTTKPAAE